VTQFDPNSIDGIIVNRAKRRVFRERISMLFAGAVLTVMVVTFYSILAG
jgi:hypothetical protein